MRKTWLESLIYFNTKYLHPHYIYEKFMRLNELTDTVLGSLQFFVFIFVWSIEINGNGPTY
jgi:hypothetical protein